jgi:hypothetical protein
MESPAAKLKNGLGGSPRPLADWFAVTDVWVDNYSIDKGSLSDPRRKIQRCKAATSDLDALPALLLMNPHS